MKNLLLSFFTLALFFPGFAEAQFDSLENINCSVFIQRLK